MAFLLHREIIKRGNRYFIFKDFDALLLLKVAFPVQWDSPNVVSPQ